MNTPTTKSEYFVEDHRWTLKLFAAKNPWYVLMFVLPMVLGMVYLISLGNLSLFKILLGVFIGAIYWSFFEYLFHRFYFHWIPKNLILRRIVSSFHLFHHARPDDLGVINSGFVTALIGYPFHYGVWFLITGGSVYFSGAIVLGLLITYYYYEWVHYNVHAKYYEKGLMRFLQEFHLTHHEVYNKNYGQISPIWDYLFQTITPNKKVMDSKKMKSFIKELRN